MPAAVAVKKWIAAVAVLGFMVVLVAAAIVISQLPSDHLVPHEIAQARLVVSLPAWRPRSEEERRAFQSATTTGSQVIDDVGARAREIIERSGQVRELVLIRDRGATVTPSVHVWVNPSSSRISIVEQLSRGMPAAESGIVVVDGPRVLAIAGVDDAGIVRFRRRNGFRGGAMHEAESWMIQLRRAGYLVTISLTAPIDAVDRYEPLFASVVESITATE